LIREVFSFVAYDSENYHIDVSGLRNWCETTKPEVIPFKIDLKLVRSFILNNEVSIDHIRELSKRADLTPIIYCLFNKEPPGPNGEPLGLLADGRHRYALAGIIKKKNIPGYKLTEDQWRPFQIKDMSLDEIKKMPPRQISVKN
jgi:hypothetical protein